MTDELKLQKIIYQKVRATKHCWNHYLPFPFLINIMLDLKVFH